MLVKIKYKMTAPSDEVIDLCEYGHEATTKWEELTYEQQNEITDSLIEEYCVDAGGYTLDINDNYSNYEDHYNEEQLEEINKTAR